MKRQKSGLNKSTWIAVGLLAAVGIYVVVNERDEVGEPG